MTISQDEVTSVSTHGQQLLLRESNMDSFTTSYNDKWIDPLTPRMLDLLEKMMRNLENYDYVGGKPFTTVSYELYGTTSAWWIILYVNGYMHPDEVSSGSLLKVPTDAAIQQFLQDTKIDNIGKTVTT